MTDLIQLEKIDKRVFERCSWVVEMRGSILSLIGSSEEVPIVVLGVTQNIGKGGTSVVIDRVLPVNTVVHCEFTFPGNAATIPTLMQVRWARRAEKGQCRLGLKFLV